MARYLQFVCNGDTEVVIRPGSREQKMVVRGTFFKGSTGNNAGFRFTSGELTGITITDGGTGYTAAATRAYADGDGKRIPLGDVTVAAGVVTAIALPTDDSVFGFASAPTIIIEGDGDGDAAATATITARDRLIRQSTNLVREIFNTVATRDWWIEIFANDDDDYAICFVEEWP